jgi:hypothetical protein
MRGRLAVFHRKQKRQGREALPLQVAAGLQFEFVEAVSGASIGRSRISIRRF